MTRNSDMASESDTIAACPICGEGHLPRYKPFCSERCRDRDLNRWLNGHYVLATNEAPEMTLHRLEEGHDFANYAAYSPDTTGWD